MTEHANPAPASEHPAPAPGAAASQPVVPEPPARRPAPAAAAPMPAGAGPAAPVVPQPPQRQSRGWLVALVAVVLFAVVCLVGIYSCSSTISTLADPFGSTASSGEAAITSDSIGIIELDGTIGYDGTLCSPEGLKAQLDRAEADRHIKAVVLRVNSGGGSATASEEMAAYIRGFSKPVVVSSAGSNMSGAYEISSQADYIFVDQTTFIGSIGTIMQTTDIGELLDKLGIHIDNIASAESKDSSYGTRPLSEEERAYYQAIVDQVNETFIQAVADGRAMDVEDVRALATGLPFTGADAVDNGLADEVGLLEDALDKAAALAGIDGYDTVYLRATSSSINDLLGIMGQADSRDLAGLAGLLEEGLR